MHSWQKILNNPHKKPIPLLYVPPTPCTQSMQQTWWPVVSTTIVSSHGNFILFSSNADKVIIILFSYSKMEFFYFFWLWMKND